MANFTTLFTASESCPAPIILSKDSQFSTNRNKISRNYPLIENSKYAYAKFSVFQTFGQSSMGDRLWKKTVKPKSLMAKMQALFYLIN